LTGETEVLGEDLSRRHFVHHKSHLPDRGANPGRHGGKPTTNRFSYGAAFTNLNTLTNSHTFRGSITAQHLNFLPYMVLASLRLYVHTRSTRRHIPEDGILHSRRREKFQILHSTSEVYTVAILVL
jgi:hypothetical protein